LSRNDATRSAACTTAADLEAAEAELARAYERWEWLEARRDV